MRKKKHRILIKNIKESLENNENMIIDGKAEEDSPVDETLENENVDENNDENIPNEEVSGPAVEIKKQESVETEDDSTE